jgi:protein-S-isoprenylcysteine O-methyltransferase Ste14
MALAVVACIILVALTERPTFSGFASGLVGFLGFVLVAIAALGRFWTSLFIAGHKDEHLVRHGPYAALRHPLYALSMLAMLGAGLASGSVAIAVALLAACGVLFFLAARGEDAWLERNHGTEFAHYRRAVRAFVPRWSALEAPETLTIRPRVLWKAFLDAGSLIGFYGLLRVADALQSGGVTPTWLTLP